MPTCNLIPKLEVKEYCEGQKLASAIIEAHGKVIRLLVPRENTNIYINKKAVLFLSHALSRFQLIMTLNSFAISSYRTYPKI